jgi:hypothetical protein
MRQVLKKAGVTAGDYTCATALACHLLPHELGGYSQSVEAFSDHVSGI